MLSMPRPELAALKDDLEFARNKLMDILAGYGAYKDYRVVIVFDAHAVAGEKTVWKRRPTDFR